MSQIKIAKKGQCDNYCIFLASKYFTTIDDYINLTFTTKRFQENFNKFYFNPISLTKNLLSFFPKIETLYLYDENDEMIDNETIHSYVILYPISYVKSMFLKMLYNVDCKKIIFTENDAKELNHFVSDEMKNQQSTNNSDHFIIPNGVQEISDNCFEDNQTFTSISIPTTVTRLGNDSFNNCDIRFIEIPESVKEIGDHCFYKCERLTKVSMPLSVKLMGIGCFKRCFDLVEIQLPTTVKVITEMMFSGCSELQTIEIPTSVTRLENCCFWCCSSLTSISIPTSVEYFGSSCFGRCDQLVSIDLPEKPNMLFFGNQIYLLTNGNLTSYNIPWSVDIINGKEIIDIEEIYIPTTVTSIGKRCFHYLEGISKIIIPTSVKRIHEEAFSRCLTIQEITIPSSVTIIENNCFYNCSNLEYVNLEAHITTLNDKIFTLCQRLKEVSLPSTIQSIGHSVFSFCYNLTKIDLPNSLTSIGRDNFSFCCSLKTITIPSSVCLIERQCFYYISSFTSITILSKDIQIKTSYFSSNDNLKEIWIYKDIEPLFESSKNKIKLLEE